MKVGVIGIGNIAQKAHLPIMAEMRDTVEWHICSRNKETLEQVGKKYDFKDVNAVK